MTRSRMEAMADLLAKGYEPDEVTLLSLVHQEMVDLVNRSVKFHLSADNVDRPNAERYGTYPDGSPCYAPEWYMAQRVKTAIHEGLYGALKGVLGCDDVDEHDHRCIGSLLHETSHWDGNGCNWAAATEGGEG